MSPMELGMLSLFGLVVVSLFIGMLVIVQLIARVLAKRRGEQDRPALSPWIGVVIACLCLMVVIIGSPIAWRNDKKNSDRNRSSAFHRAIMSGLENYHSDFGEYPKPADPDKVVVLDGKSYKTGGALMLYQALSGDGTSHVVMTGPEAGQASDGVIREKELQRVKLMEMPKEIWQKTDAGYILVDGFGHPFQYTPGDAETVNTTYDLWSFGEGEPVAKADKGVKQSTASDRWIKNW